MASFDCSICWDNSHVQPTVRFDEYSLCASCAPLTAQLFVDAFRNETRNPPRFGSTTLSILHFADFLPPHFVEAYQLKEVEYATPVQERLHCTHKIEAGFEEGVKKDQTCCAFLGARSKWTGERVVCKECNGTVCTYCRADNAIDAEDNLHICQKVQADDGLRSPTRLIHLKASHRKDSVLSVGLSCKEDRVQQPHCDLHVNCKVHAGADHGPRSEGRYRKYKKHGVEHVELEVETGEGGRKDEVRVLVRRINEWEKESPSEGAVFANADLKWARESELLLGEARKKIMAEYVQHLRSDKDMPGLLMPTYNIVRRLHSIALKICSMDKPDSLTRWKFLVAECRSHDGTVREILGKTKHAIVEWWSSPLIPTMQLVLSRLKDISEAQLITRSQCARPARNSSSRRISSRFSRPATSSNGGRLSSWVHNELARTRLIARGQHARPAASSKGMRLCVRTHGDHKS